jgi:hypothetical protein
MKDLIVLFCLCSSTVVLAQAELFDPMSVKNGYYKRSHCQRFALGYDGIRDVSLADVPCDEDRSALEMDSYESTFTTGGHTEINREISVFENVFLGYSPPKHLTIFNFSKIGQGKIDQAGTHVPHGSSFLPAEGYCESLLTSNGVKGKCDKIGLPYGNRLITQASLIQTGTDEYDYEYSYISANSNLRDEFPLPIQKYVYKVHLKLNNDP